MDLCFLPVTNLLPVRKTKQKSKSCLDTKITLLLLRLLHTVSESIKCITENHPHHEGTLLYIIVMDRDLKK